MKSGSTGGTQSHIAMSKVWYLLFGAEMALKVALSSMFCWVIEMPIFCRSDCMIWNVRSPVPRSSGGKMTLYCIGWPLAIRSPFGPILSPAWSSSSLALARLNGTTLMFGSCQEPSAGAMIVLPGWARPSQAVLMICCRSVAYSIASLTSGFSSSRCVVLCGFVLMMKVFIDSDGAVVTTKPAFFSAVTAVGGVYSPMKSTWWSLSAWTMASALEKNCSPKPSIFGLAPHQFGFRLNSAYWLALYSTSSNGPPETIGWPFDGGTFWKVFIPVPLPVKYGAQTCLGSTDMPCICSRTFATAVEYLITRVVGFGADAPIMCSSRPAHCPAGPFLYFMTSLMVQATSAAVSGLPSDHFAFGTVWKVQVRPSAEADQLRAKSASIPSLELYWTSCG